DLTLPGLTAELGDDLVHLAQAGGTDRLAVGDAAAVGVDREPAADLGLTGRDQRLLLAVLAEATLREVHDLGAALGVLELGDVDVLGSDASGGEGRGGGIGAHARGRAAPLD